MHRFGVFCLLAVVLAGCATRPGERAEGEIAARNPTVPIGAILRFDLAQFDGDWVVQSTAGGDWDLRGFAVSGGGTVWREAAGTARIAPRATGILNLTYRDTTRRDVWVVWTDPDHNTLALGTPDGSFGFVATRAGRARADQVTAARQVLDFNGYRTAEWSAGQ